MINFNRQNFSFKLLSNIRITNDLKFIKKSFKNMNSISVMSCFNSKKINNLGVNFNRPKD